MYLSPKTITYWVGKNVTQMSSCVTNFPCIHLLQPKSSLLSMGKLNSIVSCWKNSTKKWNLFGRNKWRPQEFYCVKSSLLSRQIEKKIFLSHAINIYHRKQIETDRTAKFYLCLCLCMCLCHCHHGSLVDDSMCHDLSEYIWRCGPVEHWKWIFGQY